MAVQHLRTPTHTRSLNIKILGDDYFEQEYKLSRDEKLSLVEEMSTSLVMPTMFCEINNQTHYLATVDLFMASSFEMEHRKEIVTKEILSKLKSFTNVLDIGVGKGDLTTFVGQHFKNITIVDNSFEALSSIPGNIGNSSFTKIQKSILDPSTFQQISQNSYDLILLSHMLYYIEDKARMPLFNQLHGLLSKNGIILVVYNDGLGRNQLAKDFHGRGDDFDGFFYGVMYNYNNAYALQSKEIMDSFSLDAILHVINMIVFDSGAHANYSELVEYANHELFHEDRYQIDMKQNFIFVGASDSDAF